MLRLKIFILTVFLFTIYKCSTQNEKPEWVVKSLDVNDAKFDTLNIKEIFLNEMPIVTNTDTLLKYFPSPKTILEDGASFKSEEAQKLNIRGKESMIKCKSYFYENLRFESWENNIQLTDLELINTDYKLKTPIGIFSNQTSEKDIKQLFPNSFKWRNVGLSRIFHFEQYINEDFNHERMKNIYLHNGVGKANWIIEFVLIDKQLAYVFFYNTENAFKE